MWEYGRVHSNESIFSQKCFSLERYESLAIFNNIYIRLSLKSFKMAKNILNAYIAMKKYHSDHRSRWLVCILKSNFDQNWTFWNWFVKKMVKIITIFISEITNPYYFLYGFQPFFARNVSLYMFWRFQNSPKFAKKSIFLAYYWQI